MAKSLEDALPIGVHRYIATVAQETGMTRVDILHSEGVTYRATTDEVRRDSNDTTPPKGYAKWHA